MIVRMIKVLVVATTTVFLLSALGTHQAAAADFGTLLGKKKKPRDIPYCTTARADYSKYANQQYCWDGLRAVTTWPKNLPIDRPAPAQKPVIVKPKPLVSEAQRIEGQRNTTLELIELTIQQAEKPGPPKQGLTALVVETFKNYEVTKRAGLPGHNTQTLSDLELIDCAASCNKEPWCRTFDYNWYQRKCYLSNKTASEVPLKFDYPGNPYDHFSKKAPVATAIPADTPPAPLLTPTTACRAHLKGPNPWLNNQTRTYPKAITDMVCSPLESSTKPAECFHYVMSGQVAWDKRGMSGAKPNTYTRWGTDNAAALCAGSAQGTKTVQCFGLHIARGRKWSEATASCNG